MDENNLERAYLDMLGFHKYCSGETTIFNQCFKRMTDLEVENLDFKWCCGQNIDLI
jgi:hypothetical protein